MQKDSYHPSSTSSNSESILSIDISKGGTVACGIDNGIVDILQLSNKQTITTLYPPNWTKEQSQLTDCGCNSVIFANGNQNILYCSYDRRIFKYDLRQKDALCKSFEYSKEEINQVVVNYTESYLASGDDAGCVVVIDLRSEAVPMDKCCHDSICSSVQFLPNQNLKLISAGMDCKLNYFDIERNVDPLQIIDINQINKSISNHGTTLNPPFIHHLDATYNLNRIACAANDTNIYIFEMDYQDNELIHTQCLSGHTLCANQSHFARWPVTNCLATAGNDGKLMIWDLLDDTEDDETIQYPPPVIIDHGCKVNWVSTSEISSHSVLISDLSPALTLYSNITI